MNDDTFNLLRECNAGCKSATNSMEQVLPFVEDEKLKQVICEYNKMHIKIGDEFHQMLNENGEDEKDPGVMAKAFSWISTETKLILNKENHTIADLMIDGCSMGIKSVSEYINQYKEASKECMDLAKKLVNIEFDFMKELTAFL
jgi:hypothetical protein